MDSDLEPSLARYVARSSPANGADRSQTATLNGSVGVIRMKSGFGITADGTPRIISDTNVPRAATIQKRGPSVARKRSRSNTPPASAMSTPRCYRTVVTA